MVNRTVAGGNQIPMLRHILQKEKRKKKVNSLIYKLILKDYKLGYKL